VIEGDYVGAGSAATARESAQRCEALCQMLHAADIPFSRSKDSVVEASGVGDARVAILPYNRAVSDAEAARLQAFVASGGKLIDCFVGRPDVLGLIRVQVGGAVQAQYRGEFSMMLFDKGVVFGTPPRVCQDSPAVRSCSPLPGARIIARWADSAGDPRDTPAVIVSDTGAYLSQVLTSSDMANKTLLMRALVGQWAPEIWAASVPRDPQAFGPIGRYPTISAFIAALGQRLAEGPQIRDALAEAQAALGALLKSSAMAGVGQYRNAAQLAWEAKLAARQAYWRLYPSPRNELRGVWAVNEGLPTWDTQMQELRRANFNAVYPYICSGGVAFYKSAFLYNVKSVQEHGDYLREAVQAGRKWGVQVHARMLALSTIFAPDAVRRQLEADKRLMLDTKGRPQSWLCPSDPRNRAQEVAVARELVTRYDIDGIQFDYLRYPGANCCFCPRCLAKFEHDTGLRVSKWPDDVIGKGSLADRFADWRREQITSIVREVSHAARAARPGTTVSAAVFLNWEDHRNEFGQDWKRWVDEGIVDYVCPMNYTTNPTRFTAWVKRQMAWVGGKVPVCPGIGVFADGVTFTGPQQVLDEVEIARNLGAGGFVIFNYQPELARDYLPYLALGATSAPSTFDVKQAAR
jgi:uncharacterized lipoprotein YddW (UPF0748 family)